MNSTRPALWWLLPGLHPGLLAAQTPAFPQEFDGHGVEILLVVAIACIMVFFHLRLRRETEAVTERHRCLVEAIGDSGIMLFVVDGNHRVRYMNDTMAARFGEAVGKVCYRDVGASDAPCTYCKLQHVIDNQAAVHYTPTLADGRSFDIIARPYVDIDGTPCKLEIIRDVTEQKRTEKALQEAKQTAEAANIAKNRFLATMSHEIRTPMNGILGMAQLLLGASMSEAERRDCARTIFNSGETLLTLLNDILDLSKIEADKLSLEVREVDPQQVLHDTQALFFSNAKAKGLRIDSSWIGPGHLRYRSDPHRLRQMLSNLVSNAIKFTARGSIRLMATELSDTTPSPLLEFSVTDTGAGIAPDSLDLLFKPFSQVYDPASRQFGGSGLGLSIVRKLAQALGGDVGVDSTPGRGSRFWFRVRAERVVLGEEHHTLSPSKGMPLLEDAYPQLSGRVLIVEDNPTNQLILQALLPKIGLQTALVENGREAVDFIVKRIEHIDAILMDMQMPIMDGHEATHRIRAWENANGFPALPIIAITADAFPEERERCLSSGMNDFIAKPIVIVDLVHALGRWLADDPPPLPPPEDSAAAVESLRALDVPRFLDISGALLPMLAEGRFDVIDRFAELESLAAGTPQADALCPIRQFLDAFRFDKAFEALSALRNRMPTQEGSQ